MTNETLRNLSKRLPVHNDILSVYAVIVTLLYSWTIVASLRDFASNWSLYFSLPELIAVFAYSILGAFLESLIVLLFLLGVAFILPKNYFADKFIRFGAAFALALTGSLIYLYTQTLTYGILEKAGVWANVFFCALLILCLLVEFIPFLDRVFEGLAERLSIFLYIYMPISLISLLIVIVRNVISQS